MAQEKKEIPTQETKKIEEEQVIDVSEFFNYQNALNSLISYLNESIDSALGSLPRKVQKLFEHSQQKLMLNAILETGFYEFCKYRLSLVTKSGALTSPEKLKEQMNIVRGEVDLVAYLLVNSRLVHQTLSFDLYLSLIKGGLFIDLMKEHEKIVKKMQNKQKDINRDNIKENIKLNSEYYI
ncbi:MAG: hypothetical protein GY870_21695 [archaeon]|nr:hypothetical protein [archaeon]